MDQLRVSMPPDPNPKTPTFKPPPKACDTHCHIFGPPEMFPYATTRAYTPPAAPVEHYLSMLDIIGVDRGVIVQPNAHGTDNAVSLAAVARGSERLRGVCRANDATTDEELRRLDRGGMRGVRFNFAESLGQTVNLTAFENVVERVGELGWFVEVHIDPQGLEKYAERFQELPMPVVIDSLGHVDIAKGTDQPAFHHLLDLLGQEKFWVKVAAIDLMSVEGFPWNDIVPFARTAAETAPDRVIWGTNWPHSARFEHNRTPNDGDLVDLIPRFAPEPELQHKILVENPARLFGFPD